MIGSNANPSLAAFNKIKGLLTEKENERTQLRARIQKINAEAINSKKELGEKELEIETRRKEKEW